MPFIEVTKQAETGGMTLLDIELWCAQARTSGFDDDTVPWVAVRTTRLLRAITALRHEEHTAVPTTSDSPTVPVDDESA